MSRVTHSIRNGIIRSHRERQPEAIVFECRLRYSGIEDALTVDIDEVIRSCPKPTLTTDVRGHRLKQIRIRLHTLRQRLETINAERTQLRRGSRPVQAAAGSVETEIRQLLEERKRMRIDR